MKMTRSEKKFEIWKEADVLVVGGGPAGVGAAVSAARQGKKFCCWKREVSWVVTLQPVMWKTAIISSEVLSLVRRDSMLKSKQDVMKNLAMTIPGRRTGKHFTANI